MCKASMDNPDAPDGKSGDGVRIGTNRWGMGTVHRQSGESPIGQSNDGTTACATDECLVCLHTGAELDVTDMPHDIRAALEHVTDGPIRLIFVETPGSHDVVIHDLVAIQGRPDIGQIPLAVFEGSTACLVKTPKRGEVTSEQVLGVPAATLEVTEESPVEMLKRRVEEVTGQHRRTGDDGSSVDVQTNQARVTA